MPSGLSWTKGPVLAYLMEKESTFSKAGLIPENTPRHRAGWHLVLLDSVRMDKDDPNGYEAWVDEEQFDWLTKDLAAASGKPTLILSHIPILSTTIFEGTKPNKTGDYAISARTVEPWPCIRDWNKPNGRCSTDRSRKPCHCSRA